MYKNMGLLLGLYTVGSIFAADPLADGPPVKRRCTGEGIFASEAPVVSMPVELSKQEREIVARRLKAHSITFQHCSSSCPTESDRDIYNAVMAYPLDEEEDSEADKQDEFALLRSSMADYLLQQNKPTQEGLTKSLKEFEGHLAEQQDAQQRGISMSRGLVGIQQILLAAEDDDQESIVASCKGYINGLQNAEKERAIIALFKAADYLDIASILDVSAKYAASCYRDLFSHDHPKVVEYKLNKSNINPELQRLINTHLLQKHQWVLSRRKLWACNGHEELLTSQAFNHDGSQVVSGSEDGTLCIWDVHTGEVLRKCSHDDWVFSVAFNHDGSQVVSGSEDNTLCIWDACTGEKLKEFYNHDWVKQVAFNHDGSQVVSGSADGTVCIWDVRTGRQLQQLNGHTGDALSVAFNHDSSQVLAAAFCDPVRVWDVRTGRQLQQFDIDTDEVDFAAFTHDGSQVVVSEYPGGVRVWNVQTGQELQECHNDKIYSLPSKRGSQTVSGDGGYEVIIWDSTRYAKIIRLLNLTQALYVDSQLSGDKLLENAYLNELYGSLPDNIKQILDEEEE